MITLNACIISNSTTDLDPELLICSKSSSYDDLKHTHAISRLRSLDEVSNCQEDAILTSSLSISEQISIDDNVIDTAEEIKYQSESRYSDQFKDRETHFFVLSQSGKPIFSRYGSDSQTAAFIGVMQAMISFVEAGNDKLKVMIAGKHTFVFLVRENIILVAVSNGPYVPSQLQIILVQIYHQIISMLTFRAISTAFQRQPSLDLRRLLVGVDSYLHSIIDHMESDMGHLLKAVTFVTMEESLRIALVNTVCQAVKINDVVFAMLLLDEQLVGVVRHKSYYPHPMDIHLILNLIRNAVHFNSQICWLPVCLPRFDPDGFFYAHISYIVPRLSLVILTVNPEQFDLLQDSHNLIRHLVMINGLSKKIHSLYPFDNIFQTFQLLKVRHFIYKMRGINQCISYPLNKALNGYDSKTIVRRYLPLHRIIHHPGRHGRLVYQRTDIHTILAWQTDRFELYATLEHMSSKHGVTEMVKKLLDVINKHQDCFFMTMFPTF